MKYIVFICRRCGAPVGARTDRATATCSRCYKINPTDPTKVRVIAYAGSPEEMKAAIQTVKLKRKTFPQKDKWRLKYDLKRKTFPQKDKWRLKYDH